MWAKDEPDVRVRARDAVAYKEVRGPGRVQEEVGGERRHALDGRCGQLGGVYEDDRAPLVQDLPQRVLAAGDIGATCLYAVYDPVSSCCTLARAGHVLPTVVTRDGTVDILDLPPGPPLGLVGLPFEAVEVDLPESSLLAHYTDGLIEARDHDIDAGLTLLRQALAQPTASLEATCDTVLASLLRARPDDDVALLLARTHALGSRQVASWDLAADPAAVARARSRVSQQLST